MSSDLEQITTANAQFANKVYNILSKENENVFFSPLSAHAVLSMAYQGSSGKTAQEFASTLSVPDHKTAANGYKDLMISLNNIGSVTLHLANKIFIMNNYPLKSEFSKVTSELFLSEIEPVDFAENQAAANTINQWVENKTNEKIKDLISSNCLDHLTRLVLVNAIYFKGNWADKFDSKNTRTESFYITSDNQVDCQMMHINERFNFRSDEDLNAMIIELPYDNENVGMIIILPNEIDGIADLEEKLSNVDLSKLTDKMDSFQVDLSLPKFKIETRMELKEVLQKMGLGSIFDPNDADFSEISEREERLYVGKVIQKAFIEVNEEGAEAEAATGVLICMMCMPEQFQVNHPFIFMLQVKEANTNNILFVGRISNPSIL